MKIRSGFVSNSSSSSFCLYGATMSPDDVCDMISKTFPEHELVKEYHEALESEDYDEYDEREQLFELITEKLGEIDKRFEYLINNDSDLVMFGINPMDINDDETGAEFKGTVAYGLAQVLDYHDGLSMELGEIYG